MARPYLTSKRPLCFAHRGGARLWPENTLEAFEGALKLGCRYIETDVHLSSDGVVVVHHDADLDRTTDATGPVKSRSLVELQALDAGYRFTPDGVDYPFRGKGLRIPRFEEVLDAFPDVRFNVELKQADPPMAQTFLELVRRKRATDRVLVAAADDAIVKDFRTLCASSMASSAGIREVVAFWAAVQSGTHRLLRPPFDALQVPAKHGPLPVVSKRFVRAAHAHGIQVHVWTIDDPGQMWRLLELGVDGLMSDRPDLLIDTVRLWERARGVA